MISKESIASLYQLVGSSEEKRGGESNMTIETLSLAMSSSIRLQEEGKEGNLLTQDEATAILSRLPSLWRLISATLIGTQKRDYLDGADEKEEEEKAFQKKRGMAKQIISSYLRIANVVIRNSSDVIRENNLVSDLKASLWTILSFVSSASKSSAVPLFCWDATCRENGNNEQEAAYTKPFSQCLSNPKSLLDPSPHEQLYFLRELATKQRGGGQNSSSISGSKAIPLACLAPFPFLPANAVNARDTEEYDCVYSSSLEQDLQACAYAVDSAATNETSSSSSSSSSSPSSFVSLEIMGLLSIIDGWAARSPPSSSLPSSTDNSYTPPATLPKQSKKKIEVIQESFLEGEEPGAVNSATKNHPQTPVTPSGGGVRGEGSGRRADTMEKEEESEKEEDLCGLCIALARNWAVSMPNSFAADSLTIHTMLAAISSFNSNSSSLQQSGTTTSRIFVSSAMLAACLPVGLRAATERYAPREQVLGLMLVRALVHGASASLLAACCSWLLPQLFSAWRSGCGSGVSLDPSPGGVGAGHQQKSKQEEAVEKAQRRDAFLSNLLVSRVLQAVIAACVGSSRSAQQTLHAVLDQLARRLALQAGGRLSVWGTMITAAPLLLVSPPAALDAHLVSLVEAACTAINSWHLPTQALAVWYLQTLCDKSPEGMAWMVTQVAGELLRMVIFYHDYNESNDESSTCIGDAAKEGKAQHLGTHTAEGRRGLGRGRGAVGQLLPDRSGASRTDVVELMAQAACLGRTLRALDGAEVREYVGGGGVSSASKPTLFLSPSLSLSFSFIQNSKIHQLTVFLLTLYDFYS